MTARRLAIDVLGAIAAGAVVLWLLLGGCTSRPPSTDAGPDPDVSACCNWYVFPLAYDRPGACLCDHTSEGERRWLTCDRSGE